jgi:hypothetical protein
MAYVDLRDDRRDDCSDLGCDLGYLRHGSIGRASAEWPGRLCRAAACALARGSPLCPVALRWWRAVRRSYSVELIFWKARLTYAPSPRCWLCGSRWRARRGDDAMTCAVRYRSPRASDQIELWGVPERSTVGLWPTQRGHRSQRPAHRPVIPAVRHWCCS